MLEKKFLFTRKHAGDKYDFYFWRDISWADGLPMSWITVETHEKDWDYSDTIFLGVASGQAYGELRYHPPYILRKLEKQMKAALKKYDPEQYAKDCAYWAKHGY